MTDPIRIPLLSAVTADASYVRKQVRRAIAAVTVPALLGNRRRWQQSAYTQDNITTLPNGTQYMVVVDNLLHPILCKRSSPESETWQTFDLRLATGDPFGTQADDSHNTFTVAVSADGHIHVTGNMHSDPMRYAKSTVAGDITSMATGPFPTTNADKVTYCMDVLVGTNQNAQVLNRFYRNGLATSGDFYRSVYDTSTGTWSTPVKLFNGIVSDEGAYLHHIAIRGNKIGIFFLWRGAGDASTNTDLGYVQSVDGGATWQRVDGTAQTVPVTHANAQTIIPTPIQTGLINQGGADLDAAGRPHVAIQLYAASGASHYFHVWHNGTAWVTEDVTPNWRERNETIGQTTLFLKLARAALICTDGGRTYMIGRTIGEGLNGRPVMIDCSPGASRRPFVVFDHDLAGWEPAIDSRALRQRGELNMLVTSIDQNADSKQGWIRQRGWVLTIQVDQLPAIQAGQVRVPGLRKIMDFPYAPEITPVGGTAEANVVSMGVAQIDVAKMLGVGAELSVRLSCRITLNSPTTSGKIFLRATPSAGTGLTTEDICTLNVVSSSYTGIQSTPVEPLALTPYIDSDGFVRDTRLIPRVSTNDAAGFKLGAWNVEVFVTDKGY